MRRESFIVTEADVPPANHPDRSTQCGWCKSTIGEEHEAECPCRERSVVATMTVQFVTTIPEHWSEEDFEFFKNGNRFCASNYVDALHEQNVCVCGGVKFVREADEKDERNLPMLWGWRGITPPTKESA